MSMVMNNGVSQLEQQQQQQLQEIGAQLRYLREQSQLSIEQITARTMIQPRQLEAIELGRLNQLPEPVYIRGLIKRYADALGADGEVLAAAFPTTLRVQPRPVVGLSSGQLRPIHLYAAYIVLIAAAVSGLSYLVNRSAPRMTPPSLADQIPASSTPSSSSNASAVMATTPAASQKPVQIAINLTAQSWMRVVVDGKTDFEGILQEGTQRTWTADRDITVRAGNAGGVLLAYNNQQPKPMGKPGTVEELTFSATTAPAQANQQASTMDAQASSVLR